MAQINKYRGEKWRARIRKVGYPEQAKTFDTKRDAEKWARAIESSIDNGGQLQDVQEAKGITIGSIFERYLAEQTPLKKSSKGERNTIKRLLLADFMVRRLNQLKPEDIRAWRNLRITQVSAASVNREYTTLNSIINYAMREWAIPMPINPCKLVSRPQGSDVHRNQRWTDEDIKKVLLASGHKDGQAPFFPKDYVGWAVQVALETAMRMGEICLLKVADFHAAERYCYLETTKNGSARQVPLSTKAIKILELLTKGKQQDDLIFPPKGTLGVYFRDARNKAGLQGQTFHDFRHESATRWSKKFPNVLELSAVTGHKSLQSLKRYYNPTAMELALKMG